MRWPALATLLVLCCARPVVAEPPAGDTGFSPTEPDVVVLTLPTTLSLPRGGGVFRVTHRFTRPLGQDDFGALAADLFGLDSSAQVGLELRFGVARGLQAGVYRTSDRTLALFAQQTVLRQGRGPLGVAVHASIEGRDNLREEHSPRLGLVLSRTLGRRAALYVEPAWIGNTNLGPEHAEQSESSVLVGLGARVLLARGLYVAGEVSPRVAGYHGTRIDGRTSAPQIGVGLEKQAGGHVFQLDVSNAIGTTPAQVARAQDGGVADWFIGFAVSRKFY